MADGSAITLPLRTDPIPEGVPSALKVYKVTVSGDTTATQFDRRVGSGDSAATVAIFTVPYGYHIYDVGWRVVTAFTAGATLTIGDTDDADGWAKTGDIAATVVDTEVLWSRGVAFEFLASTTDIADTTVFPAYAAMGRFVEADTVGSPLNMNIVTAGTMTDIVGGLIEIYMMAQSAFFQSPSS